MALPTQPVTCRFYDQSGNPAAGARVVFRLNRTEVYDGLVAPELVEATADAGGECVVSLFPNELGSEASQYEVKAWNADDGRKILDALCSVPNSPCLLHEIIYLEPYPAVDQSLQALLAAQSALASVTEQRLLAEQVAADAQADAASAAASALAAQTSGSAVALAGSLSASTGAALIGYLPAGVGAVATDVQSKTQESVSLFDFLSTDKKLLILARSGAVVDVEVELALAYTAGKTKLHIPGGVYLTTLEIKVPSNSYIYGDGVGQTVIRRVFGSAAGQNGFTNSNNTRNDSNTGNENIVIKDLEIIGALGNTTGSVGSGTTGCGIGLAFVKNVVIENVYSRDWTKHCFDVGAKYYWTSSNPKPLEYVPGASKNVTLRNCIGTNSGDDIITTHFSGSITIENPYCFGAPNPTDDFGNRNGIEIDDGSYDVTVIGGLIENCNRGIEVKGHDYAPAATRVRVYGTTIRNCSRCIDLRHLTYYGTGEGLNGYSATAKDVLIHGVTVYAPRGTASGSLTPRAIRVSSYDGVRVVGMNVVQVDGTLGGGDGESDDEETTSPIYIHQGAKNVTFENLSVNGYTTATDSIVRVTGSGRGNVRLLNSRFDGCTGVPVISISGSLPGIRVDGVNAEQSGAAIAAAVMCSYQPESVGTTIENVSVAGYTNAVQAALVGAQGLPGMTFGTDLRWVVADSTGGATAVPQEVFAAGWSEGGQDLGIGEGVKYSFRMKLNASATLWEGAYVASYKESTLESDTSTALRFATRATTDAGTGATDRWEVMSNGALRSLMTGNPEGTITAPVGAIWVRSDGTPGATLYVKESGIGNTGWAAK